MICVYFIAKQAEKDNFLGLWGQILIVLWTITTISCICSFYQKPDRIASLALFSSDWRTNENERKGKSGIRKGKERNKEKKKKTWVTCPYSRPQSAELIYLGMKKKVVIAFKQNVNEIRITALTLYRKIG